MQDDPTRIPLRARDKSIRAYALVDPSDAHLAEHRWCLSTYYAVRFVRLGAGREYKLYLHRAIFGLGRGDERRIDHINGDHLDNRRCNLRIATQAQNSQNQAAQTGCSSVYRGVTWHRGGHKWMASAKLNGRRHYLGLFEDEREAAEVARAWRTANMPFTNEERSTAA